MEDEPVLHELRPATIHRNGADHPMVECWNGEAWVIVAQVGTTFEQTVAMLQSRTLPTAPGH